MRLLLSARQRWLVFGAVGLLVVMAGTAMFHQHGLTQAAEAPPVQQVKEAKAPPEHRLVVDVGGAVRRPGVYELAPGARVRDAIAAAGGAAAAGEAQTLNQAAFVADGDKVYVPTAADITAAESGSVPPAAWSATRSAPLLAAGGLRVDLNRAERSELLRLPGLTGPMAANILRYRKAHGHFQRIDELRQVAGIDPETYARLAPHVFAG